MGCDEVIAAKQICWAGLHCTGRLSPAPGCPCSKALAWYQWSPLPLCLTQQAGEDLVPAAVHVWSSSPSFTPLGHGEHLVHLSTMNYIGRRSRYISPLSIIQRMCFFFFFFTMGQYKQRWHFSFPEAQGNFYCFTSSWGTLKNQTVQSAGPRGCLDAP